MSVNITTDRIHTIAQLAGVDDYTAYDCIMADWPNDEEHAEWIESASDQEIADWLTMIIELYGRR